MLLASCTLPSASHRKILFELGSQRCLLLLGNLFVINVLELDDLFGVLWHWCCSVPSPHLLAIAKDSLRWRPSSSSAKVALLTSWSSAKQSGIVQTRVRPAETSELSVTSLFQHGTARSCRCTGSVWKPVTGVLHF